MLTYVTTEVTYHHFCVMKLNTLAGAAVVEGLTEAEGSTSTVSHARG